MKLTDKKTPKQRIDELLDKATGLLKDAATIADEHGVDFYWHGPGYGFGGSYRAAVTDWKPSSCEWEQSDQNKEGEWLSSSDDC